MYLLAGIHLDVCLNRNEKKKKNKPCLPRIARHSNRTQCTAFPCVALVITAALTGDSRRECVCISDSGAQRRNVWAFYLLFSLLFIFSALWRTWTVTCEDLCKCRGRRLLTRRVPLTFTVREIYLPVSLGKFSSTRELTSLRTLFDFSPLLSTVPELGSGPPVTSLSSLTSPALCNLTRSIVYSTLRVGFMCFLVSGRLFSCFIFIFITEIGSFSWGPLWQHCPGFAWSEHSTLTFETPTLISARC